MGISVHLRLRKILILQKKTVRILTGNRYFQIYGEQAAPLPRAEPLFKTLEILKFDDIFKTCIANFVFSTLAHETISGIGLRTVT